MEYTEHLFDRPSIIVEGDNLFAFKVRDVGDEVSFAFTDDTRIKFAGELSRLAPPGVA